MAKFEKMEESVAAKLGAGAAGDEGGFDNLLELILPHGKYQKRFLYGILVPLSITGALGMVNVFMFYVPDHWCHDPNWANDTAFATYEEWKNHTIPRKMGDDGEEAFSKCEMFADSKRKARIKCPHGWEYDKSDMSLTMPSEFDWVCDKQKYPTILFTMTGASSMLGTVLTGPAIDRFGRRIFYIVFTFLGTILNTMLLFLPKHFEVYVGLSMVSCLLNGSPEIILLELSDSEFRSWTSATLFTTFVIGMAAVPLIAWSVGNWFYIGLILAAVQFPTFVYFFCVPESPRWLISRGRIEAAKVILKEVARTNGTLDKVQDEQLDSELKALAEQAEKQKMEENSAGLKGYWTLLSHAGIAKHTALLAITGCTSCFVYSGITLNTPYMPGNQFLAFFLLAIIEMPSSIAGGYLMQFLGRRWTPVIFYTLSGISCLLAAATITNPTVVTTCIMVSKFSINLTLLVHVVQIVELYPTRLRATGSSLTNFIISMIGLAMPTLVNFGRSNARIPYIGFAAFSILGATAAVFIPETLHQNLPETVTAANEFGKDHAFFSIRPTKRLEARKFIPMSSIRRIHPELSSQSRSRSRTSSKKSQVSSAAGPPKDSEEGSPSASTSEDEESTTSVVTFVSQVHPPTTSFRRRRPSVMAYVGP